MRLAHEVMEDYGNFENTVVIGLQPRGVFLSRRMMEVFPYLLPDTYIPYGELDVTFFRDDFRFLQK